MNVSVAMVWKDWLTKPLVATALLDAHNDIMMKSSNVDRNVEARLVPALLAGDVGLARF
jgi:hypothetical protein